MPSTAASGPWPTSAPGAAWPFGSATCATSATGSRPPAAPAATPTRFFVAPVPPGQAHAHDDGEAVDSEWVRPQVALDRFAADEWELILPTERSLRALVHFDTVAAVLAHLDTRPPLTDDHGGRRIALPHEAEPPGEASSKHSLATRRTKSGEPSVSADPAELGRSVASASAVPQETPL